MRLPRDPSRFLPLFGLLLAAGSLAACATDARDTADGKDVGQSEDALTNTDRALKRLGAKSCADNRAFRCVTLKVPLDHFDARNPKTIGVTFAVKPAKGPRRGVMLNIQGGPGYPGIPTADDWGSIDARIPKEFDVVYFDLRGVGASGAMDCPHAAEKFYKGALRAMNDVEERALAAKAATFSVECPKEMGVSNADLAHYTTRQAVEDIEAFRKALGYEAFTVYGLSYGTQLGQTYAAYHADRVTGLVIDGVVDLALTDPEYAEDLAKTTDGLLTETLRACNDDAACSRDMGRDAFAVYDALAASFDAGPRRITFTLSNGRTTTRTMTRSEFDRATSGAVDGPDDRAAFLHAMATADHDGDFAPFLALLYDSQSVDPDTTRYMGSGMSDGMYYAFTCNDYGRAPGETDASRLADYFAHAARVRATSPRIVDSLYGDLPCVTWPSAKGARSALPNAAVAVPTIVLGASGDAATPYLQGIEVAKRLTNVRLVTVQGGEHVMYGRELACPDRPVSDFVVAGTMPTERETLCPNVLVAPY